MQFHFLASKLGEIEAVSGRLEITAILAEIFPQVAPDECQAVFNLIQGQLLPPYQGLVYQLSEKSVIVALAKLADQLNLLTSTGGGQAAAENLFGEEDLTFLENQIKQLAREKSDLGQVAEYLLQNISSTPSISENALSINQVYSDLLEIARESGEGSQERKQVLLQKLLSRSEAISARYIIRMILGKMRLGFSLMTILDGLSWTMTPGTKAETSLLEDTFQKKADLAQLAQVYLSAPDPIIRRQMLEKYTVQAGVPVVTALCQRLNSATEIIEKMTEVYVEPKYDGMRVQIHFDRSIDSNKPHLIKSFTRKLEDISHMFPELQQIPEFFPQAQSFILDSEAIAYNPQTGELRPFQDTITRKRKHGIDTAAAETPIRFYIFDILSLDGKSLIDQSLSIRKSVLDTLFTDNPTFMHSPAILMTDATELHDFHLAKLAEGLEGVVAKQAISVYQSGRKGWSWVKIKEEEGTRGKLNDTLDLVVMGLYLGKGRRQEFGVGAFLVGIRSADGNQIYSLSKVGTGLSDDQFRELKNRSITLQTDKPSPLYKVDKNLLPDIWLTPEMIVEIAADEITASSMHTAGFSLRFPRLIRWRDDKNTAESTSLAELEQIRLTSS